MTPDIHRTLLSWANAIQANDIDAISSLYGEHFSLFSTFSPVPITERSALREYFQTLFTRDQLTVVFQANNTFSQVIDDNIICLTGLYDFSYLETNDMTTTVPARYTFLVNQTDASIIHHHSSILPAIL